MKLWDVATNTNIATLEGHRRDVFAVSFSPDGATLASGAQDDTVKLWDIATHKNIATLEGHTWDVYSVSFSPDGTTLASGARDGTVRLWDVAEAKLPRPSKLVKISGDNQQGTFGSPLANPLVIEVRDQYDNPFPGAQVKFTVTTGNAKLNERSTVEQATTDANGRAERTLILGSVINNTVDVSIGYESVRFDALGVSPAHIVTLTGHTWRVTSVAFSPDGATLASGSWDDTVKLWDVAAHTNIATLEGHADSVRSVAFSPDGTILALGSSSERIELWDVAAKVIIAMLQGNRYAHSVQFSPDGTLFAAGDGAHETVKLWDMATHVNIATFEGHRNDVNSVAFSPDGTTLASGSWDATVKLWNVVTHTNIATLEGHEGSIRSVSFSPDGATLASGGGDATVKLWEVATHINIATLEGHTDTVTSVAFSPDGTILASGSNDATVKLWEVATHINIATLEGHADAVTSVAFSPDGTTLASGSDDDTVKLWDMLQHMAPAAPSASLAGDINGDGVLNIQDLVLVAANFGKPGQNATDVNRDGVVNIQDLVQVAGTLENTTAAPSLPPQALEPFTAADVKQWIIQAQQLELTDATSQSGIFFLEQLLATLTPKETTLLPNYPNPFNPETWIPYRLAEDAFVTLTIYDGSGRVVRTLDVGHRIAAVYESRSKAIYWDGRNDVGEQVASDVYFYHLSAGDYSKTRRMVILK